MKKLLFLSLFILFMNVNAMAWSPISFTVNFDDDYPIGKGNTIINGTNGVTINDSFEVKNGASLEIRTN